MNRKTTLFTLTYVLSAMLVGAATVAIDATTAAAQDGTDALRFMQRAPALSTASIECTCRAIPAEPPLSSRACSEVSRSG